EARKGVGHERTAPVAATRRDETHSRWWRGSRGSAGEFPRRRRSRTAPRSSARRGAVAVVPPDPAPGAGGDAHLSRYVQTAGHPYAFRLPQTRRHHARSVTRLPYRPGSAATRFGTRTRGPASDRPGPGARAGPGD